MWRPFFVLVFYIFLFPFFSFATGVDSIPPSEESPFKRGVRKLFIGLPSQDLPKYDSIGRWLHDIVTQLNFNQSTFSNWAAGGESAIAFSAICQVHNDYSRGRFSFNNFFNARYGIINTKINPWRKNVDNLDLNQKVGYAITPKIDLTALSQVQTQFAPGYAPNNDSIIVSRFMAPGIWSVSLGSEWKAVNDKKNDIYLSVFLSPLSGRLIFVVDEEIANAGTYTGEPAEYDSTRRIIRSGTRVRKELGTLMNIGFRTPLSSIAKFQTVFTARNNYTDVKHDNRWNFDINWTTQINIQVNKFLAINFQSQLIYDQNVAVPLIKYVEQNGKTVAQNDGTGMRVQWNHLLGIGLSYNYNYKTKQEL